MPSKPSSGANGASGTRRTIAETKQRRSFTRKRLTAMALPLVNAPLQSGHFGQFFFPAVPPNTSIVPFEKLYT